jgi:uncharacterized membrane protein
MNNGISFDQGSVGNAINNNGQVVGTTNEFFLTGLPPGHAFIYSYSDNTEVDLEPGPSRMESDGLAINSAGDVTGFLSTGICNSGFNPACLAPFHAFVYQGSGLVDIGTLGGTYSEGTGINGSYTAANGSSHASLYREGKLIDLNDLVDPSLTFLTNASGISDNGKIVASGLNGHLYVLTPK